MREIDGEPVFSDAASDLCREPILWLIRSTIVKKITRLALQTATCYLKRKE